MVYFQRPFNLMDPPTSGDQVVASRLSKSHGSLVNRRMSRSLFNEDKENIRDCHPGVESPNKLLCIPLQHHYSTPLGALALKDSTNQRRLTSKRTFSLIDSAVNLSMVGIG